MSNWTKNKKDRKSHYVNKKLATANSIAFLKLVRTTHANNNVQGNKKRKRKKIKISNKLKIQVYVETVTRNRNQKGMLTNIM